MSQPGDRSSGAYEQSLPRSRARRASLGGADPWNGGCSASGGIRIPCVGGARDGLGRDLREGARSSQARGGAAVARSAGSIRCHLALCTGGRPSVSQKRTQSGSSGRRSCGSRRRSLPGSRASTLHRGRLACIELLAATTTVGCSTNHAAPRGAPAKYLFIWAGPHGADSAPGAMHHLVAGASDFPLCPRCRSRERHLREGARLQGGWDRGRDGAPHRIRHWPNWVSTFSGEDQLGSPSYPPNPCMLRQTANGRAKVTRVSLQTFET